MNLIKKNNNIEKVSECIPIVIQKKKKGSERMIVRFGEMSLVVRLDLDKNKSFLRINFDVEKSNIVKQRKQSGCFYVFGNNNSMNPRL